MLSWLSFLLFTWVPLLLQLLICVRSTEEDRGRIQWIGLGTAVYNVVGMRRTGNLGWSGSQKPRCLFVLNWPRQPCQPRVAHDGAAGGAGDAGGAWKRARPTRKQIKWEHNLANAQSLGCSLFRHSIVSWWLSSMRGAAAAMCLIHRGI